MDSITITNARLSLIAGQCFFAHQWSQPPAATPVLWRQAHYGAAFNRIRGGQTGNEFAAAWRPSQRSTFWSLYLGGRPLGGVSADTAWDAAVPLRLTPPGPVAVSTDNPDETVNYDCYGYPHGLILAMTIQTPRKQTVNLSDWRDRIRQLRLDQPFTVTVPGGETLAGAPAKAAVDAILAWYRSRYFGDVGEVFQSPEPLSINAVIQGAGVDPLQPLSEDLRRTLHAVTDWPADWQAATLPDLVKSGVVLPVSTTNSAPGDALYGTKRGRTLWRPGLFTARPKPGAHARHTLSCLHHNLVAAAAQAESLRLFAIGYFGSPDAQAKLDDEVVRKIARLIDALRRGAGTYRSSSVRLLLENANSKTQVDALLTGQGFAGLA